MTKYTENFSSNLKGFRRNKNLTQKQLAEVLGYSDKTVSKWECGACIPDIDALFDISIVTDTGAEVITGSTRMKAGSAG